VFCLRSIYDNLNGDTKRDKIREIILDRKRNNRLKEFYDLLKRICRDNKMATTVIAELDNIIRRLTMLPSGQVNNMSMDTPVNLVTKYLSSDPGLPQMNPHRLSKGRQELK